MATSFVLKKEQKKKESFVLKKVKEQIWEGPPRSARG
jgi:hypothetical protein